MKLKTLIEGIDTITEVKVVIFRNVNGFMYETKREDLDREEMNYNIKEFSLSEDHTLVATKY